MSWGESNTRCRASVSSTTPRLEPRCPPRADTVPTISSRISAARAPRASPSRRRRSAGARMASRSPGPGEPAAGFVRPASASLASRRGLAGGACAGEVRVWRRALMGWGDETSVSDLDVLQDAQGVGDEDGDRVVGADEVGDDRLLADAHEPHREAGLVLVRDARLVEPHHPLVV